MPIQKNVAAHLEKCMCAVREDKALREEYDLTLPECDELISWARRRVMPFAATEVQVECMRSEISGVMAGMVDERMKINSAEYEYGQFSRNIKRCRDFLTDLEAVLTRVTL